MIVHTEYTQLVLIHQVLRYLYGTEGYNLKPFFWVKESYQGGRARIGSDVKLISVINFKSKVWWKPPLGQH